MVADASTSTDVCRSKLVRHRRSEYPNPNNMAIIFPSNTKGMTAGALRQIKQQGYTTAAGGWHSLNRVYNMAIDATLYLKETEPLGKYMSVLEKTKDDADAMTEALIKSTTTMVDQAKEAHKQMQDINGKLRDGAEKLGLAIEKFNKVAGNTNFAETAKQAESLVSSLERLAALEASGMLDKVMKAMAK